MSRIDKAIASVLENNPTYVILDKVTPARVRDGMKFNAGQHKMHLEDLLAKGLFIVVVSGAVCKIIDKWNEHIIISNEQIRENKKLDVKLELELLEKEVTINAKIVD